VSTMEDGRSSQRDSPWYIIRGAETSIRGNPSDIVRAPRMRVVENEPLADLMENLNKVKARIRGAIVDLVAVSTCIVALSGVRSEVCASTNSPSVPEARIIVPVESISPIGSSYAASEYRGLPADWAKYGAASLWFEASDNLPARGKLPAPGKTGFVLYRPDAKAGVWHPVAFSSSDVREPGREIGLKAFFKPARYMHSYQFMTSIRAMTPQFVALVTRHACRDLLATVIVHRPIDEYAFLTLENIRLQDRKSDGPPCADAGRFPIN